MATIFQQALFELDTVKRGLSAANAQLFKGAIQAADHAQEALQKFITASETAQGALSDMIKVQAILTGKEVPSARGAKPGGKREKGPCMVSGCKNPATGGKAGAFCPEHFGTPAAEKVKKLDPAARTALKKKRVAELMAITG